MNRKITQLGSVAVLALFSCAAIAQVATKPRPRTEEVVRPGATGVQARPNVQTKGLENKFERIQSGNKAAEAQGQVCSLQELASNLVKDTRVSYADAYAALQFWGSRISIGTCSADAGGLLSYNAQARNNFLKAAVAGMNTLNGKKDFSGEVAKQTWAQALADAKNEAGGEKTTAAAELATVEALQNNCQILRLSN